MRDKVIAITGGTGSLGYALVRRILAFSPRKIIVFSRDEFKQSEMRRHFSDDRIAFVIGDVRDPEALSIAIKGADIVIHAAAYKHVRSGEEFPWEVIKTNVLGSYNVASCAERYGVEKCLLISSDKAVEPLNAYGMSKGMAEKIFTSENKNSKTTFASVRYGNVIGSRGSVLEDMYKSQPKEINVTDPEMTRFWLSIDEACDLVFYALENMKGGEIFVPKIGAMRLLDVFRAVVPNAVYNIVGIGMGEKIDETLISPNETRRTIDNGYCWEVLPDYWEGRRPGKVVKKKFFLTSRNCMKQYTAEEFLGEVKK